jgi:hypothetical protein
MAISKDWCETASINILTFVWKGYDLLVNEVFSEIDCSQAEDDIERDITQLHKAFTNIAKKVSCTLNNHPDFPERDHKTSDHQRVVPPGKSYPAEFRCHHLLLKIIAKATNNIPSV